MDSLRRPANGRVATTGRSSVSGRVAVSNRLTDWSPLLLNPAFWADPTNASTRTMAGSTISALADAAGSGKSLTKGAGGVTLDSTTLLNGLPSIQFALATNATLRSISGSGISGKNPHSLHVMSDFNVDPASGYAVLLALGPESGSATVSDVLGSQHTRYMASLGNTQSTSYDNLPHMLSLDWDGAKTYMYLDGLNISPSPYNTALNITDDSFSIGYSVGGTYNAPQSRIREAIFPGRITSPAERGALCRYWVKKYRLTKTTANVIFHGDSITYGTGATHGSTDWPTVAMASTNSTRTGLGQTSLLFLNQGIPGETAQNGQNTFQVNIAPNYSGRRDEVYVVAFGTNDLFNGEKGQLVYEQIRSICSLAYSQGYGKVLLCTVILSSAYSGSNATERTNLNTLIRNNAVQTGVCDAIIDFDLNANLILGTDYSDTLHPNASGYAKMATVANPLILASASIY